MDQRAVFLQCRIVGKDLRDALESVVGPDQNTNALQHIAAVGEGSRPVDTQTKLSVVIVVAPGTDRRDYSGRRRIVYLGLDIGERIGGQVDIDINFTDLYSRTRSISQPE